ncbi:hypothetical protein ACVOMT_10320 [Sphingomonas panni]
MAHPDLAIYDMDKTITRVATWTPFLRHVLKERGRGRCGCCRSRVWRSWAMR